MKAVLGAQKRGERVVLETVEQRRGVQKGDGGDAQGHPLIVVPRKALLWKAFAGSVCADCGKVEGVGDVEVRLKEEDRRLLRE